MREESGDEENGNRNDGAEEDGWGQEAALVARGTQESIVEGLQQMGILSVSAGLQNAEGSLPFLASLLLMCRFEVVACSRRSDGRERSLSGIPFSRGAP